jgi:hypothetical protein
MVLVKLLGNENGICRYEYQPEKDGKPGVLSYDVHNDLEVIEELAENDIKPAFYRTHVFSMIRKNKENPPKEQLLIWY